MLHDADGGCTSDTRSMREYDLIADWYSTDRGRSVGAAEALAVVAALPAGSRILDVGCCNGVPITEALLNAGHRVVAPDSSTGMVAQFRVNLPRTPVVRGDARRCPFANSGLDAAILWRRCFTSRMTIRPWRLRAYRVCSNQARRFSSQRPKSMASTMPALQAR